MESNLSFEARFVALCANASDSKVTSEIWKVEDKTAGQVTAAFILLLAVFGLPWNLLVMVTILKQKLYKQPTIILLLNLVIIDLLLILFVLPFQIATGFRGEFSAIGTSDLSRCNDCQAGLISSVFTLMSLGTISFMSFDRFLFIYKPLRYEKLITSVRVLIILAVLWIFTIIVALLPLLGFGEVVFSSSFLSCEAIVTTGDGIPNRDAVIGYTVMVFIIAAIPIILLVIFDLWVVAIVLRNIKAIYKVKRSLGTTGESKTQRNDFFKQMKKKRHKKRVHLIEVFGGLLCFNLIAWLPAIIIGISVAISGDSNLFSAPLYSLIHILFITQVVTHPFAETFLIKDVRDPIKNILLCTRFRKEIDMSASGPDSGCDCCGYRCDDGHVILRFHAMINTIIVHHHPHSQLNSNSPHENSNHEGIEVARFTASHSPDLQAEVKLPNHDAGIVNPPEQEVTDLSKEEGHPDVGGVTHPDPQEVGGVTRPDLPEVGGATHPDINVYQKEDGQDLSNHEDPPPDISQCGDTPSQQEACEASSSDPNKPT